MMDHSPPFNLVWPAVQPFTRLARPDDVWSQNLSLAATPEGGLVVAWLEHHFEALIRMAWVDPKTQQPPIIKDVVRSRQLHAVALAPLPNGRAAFTTAQANMIVVGVADRTQPETELYPIGIGSSGTQPSIFALNDNRLFVSWKQAAAVHLIEDKRTYLVQSDARAFATGAGKLRGSTILLLKLEQADPYLHPPRYPLIGTMLQDGIVTTKTFNMLLPLQIFGNMNCWPGEFAAHAFADGSFVVVWILMSHHRGSLVQYQHFNREGSPLGDIVHLSASEEATCVTSLTIAPVGPSTIAVGWVRFGDEISRYELVYCDIVSRRIARTLPSPWLPFTGCLTLASNGTTLYAAYLERSQVVIAHLT